MSNHPVQYDRGFIEAIVSMAPQLQAHAFLDNREREKSAYGQPKEYTDGFISGLNLLSSFLDKHRKVPRYVYEQIHKEIDRRQAIMGHTPKFKVDGKETVKEELSKTPINREKVHVDAIGRIYTSKSELPKFAPGTDGSRSNKPVFDGETGGCKPEGNSVIEALAKATHVPVHLVKGSKDITEGRTMPVVHNIYVIPDHFAGFKNRVLDYIMVPPPKTEFYSVGDQIIISEVSYPTYEKTGDHMHVMVKNLQAIGDKILLLFDMSGDF